MKDKLAREAIEELREAIEKLASVLGYECKFEFGKFSLYPFTCNGERIFKYNSPVSEILFKLTKLTQSLGYEWKEETKEVARRCAEIVVDYGSEDSNEIAEIIEKEFKLR